MSESIIRGMSITDNLTRLIFPHKRWPYPRGKKEIRRVVTIAVIITLLVLGSIIAGLKYEEQKTLTRRDMQFAAQDLTSYSNEMLLLGTKSVRQPLIQPYREIYFQQLNDNISTVHKKLVDHMVTANLQSQARQLVSLSGHLSQILAAFSRQPSDETLQRNLSELHDLARQAKHIEESL